MSKTPIISWSLKYFYIHLKYTKETNLHFWEADIFAWLNISNTYLIVRIEHIAYTLVHFKKYIYNFLFIC